MQLLNRNFNLSSRFSTNHPSVVLTLLIKLSSLSLKKILIKLKSIKNFSFNESTKKKSLKYIFWHLFTLSIFENWHEKLPRSLISSSREDFSLAYLYFFLIKNYCYIRKFSTLCDSRKLWQRMRILILFNCFMINLLFHFPLCFKFLLIYFYVSFPTLFQIFNYYFPC